MTSKERRKGESQEKSRQRPLSNASMANRYDWNGAPRARGSHLAVLSSRPQSGDTDRVLVDRDTNDADAMRDGDFFYVCSPLPTMPLPRDSAVF